MVSVMKNLLCMSNRKKKSMQIIRSLRDIEKEHHLHNKIQKKWNYFDFLSCKNEFHVRFTKTTNKRVRIAYNSWVFLQLFFLVVLVFTCTKTYSRNRAPSRTFNFIFIITSYFCFPFVEKRLEIVKKTCKEKKNSYNH